MAIQPIDLQTLFTQMDKVGKIQSAQKEGLAVQQAIQGVEHQRKTDEHIRSVNEAQDMGEGVQKTKDRDSRERDGKRKKKENKAGVSEKEETNNSVFRNPFLGRNIDISL